MRVFRVAKVATESLDPIARRTEEGHFLFMRRLVMRILPVVVAGQRRRLRFFVLIEYGRIVAAMK